MGVLPEEPDEDVFSPDVAGCVSLTASVTTVDSSGVTAAR